MSAIELNERLTDLTEEITQINEQTKLLTQKRTSALSEQNEESAKTIRRQLQELQERLEDITIMKTAVESKLRVYKKESNLQEAAEIRKHVTELWSQGTEVLDKMQPALKDLANVPHEIDQLNHSMQELAADHEKLIGETIAVPLIPVPQHLRDLVAVRFPDLSKTLHLKLHSQLVREAKEREEAAFNERISKQKTQILPYLESANLTWPKCKSCSRDLICIGGSVYDGRPQAGRPEGLGPDHQNKKAFRLQFICEVAPHNGREGFIRIDAGPYEMVPLTQLEVVR